MFSVVIPAYNAEKTIDACLESVFRQTAFDLIDEIFVVDDGSKDHTSDIVKTFIAGHDMGQIIKLIRQENHGASYARNVAIKAAKADWIALLDADDIWLDNKLEIQNSIINNNPGIVFLGACYPLKLLFRKYSGLRKLNPVELCIRNMPFPSSVIYKRENAIELGLYSTDMRFGEDLNFHQKFFKYDSYYVAAEDLVRIGICKDYTEQSGMSANIFKMYQGRNTNIRELFEMGFLSKACMELMLIFSFIKHIRKVALCIYNRVKYRKSN